MAEYRYQVHLSTMNYVAKIVMKYKLDMEIVIVVKERITNNANPNLLKEITMMELTKGPRGQEFSLSLFFASCIENRRIEIS